MQEVPNNVVVIETTTNCILNARKIAKSLLLKRYAACIQVSEVMSYFFWNNKNTEEKEYKISAKTLESICKKALEDIKSLHPYSVPELVVYKPEDVDMSYRKWIISFLCSSE